MFNSISWQDFFQTAFVATGSYYLISIPLLYSKEIIRRFKVRETATAKSNTTPERKTVNNLMGAVKDDQPVRVNAPVQRMVNADEISVLKDASETATKYIEDALVIGTVSDLLQEIKTIANMIAESNGTKEDATSAFESLLTNYVHLSSTKYREAIDVVLYDHCKNQCGFQIEITEIKSWWRKESSK